MKYASPICRKDTAKGHHYLDANGVRVPGVTTILDGGIPKKALINWAGKTTAEYALDNWEDLAQLSPAKRLDRLNGGRYAEKDAAANRGTETHRLAEKLNRGEQVDVPDELEGHVRAYVAFLDTFRPEPVHIEFSVASYEHGYAGTGDAIMYFPDGIPDSPWQHLDDPELLVDIKTNKSGIFGETALQLAAYRFADVLIDDDGEQDMPAVDGCAAIHVTADAARLIPVTAEHDQFEAFLHAQAVYEWDKHSRDLVGPAVPYPGGKNRLRVERSFA